MISPLNRAAAIFHPGATGAQLWRSVPWERITASDVRFIMSQIQGSPATRNKALAALKGVARAAWELNLLSTEELTRIRSIKGDAGSRDVAGRYVVAGELAALLEACALDLSPAGVRDATMITFAALTGARRAELAGLSVDTMQAGEDGTTSFRLIGKRNKERLIYVTGSARPVLRDWLALRGTESGPLFCRIRKDGVIYFNKGLTPTALDRILRKRAKRAGVADVDWHDLRRTTASNLLDAGADIAVVAKILGHSNVQTTARYDRRGERAKIKASELVSVPYFKREVACLPVQHAAQTGS